MNNGLNKNLKYPLIFCAIALLIYECIFGALDLYIGCVILLSVLVIMDNNINKKSKYLFIFCAIALLIYKVIFSILPDFYIDCIICIIALISIWGKLRKPYLKVLVTIFALLSLFIYCLKCPQVYKWTLHAKNNINIKIVGKLYSNYLQHETDAYFYKDKELIGVKTTDYICGEKCDIDKIVQVKKINEDVLYIIDERIILVQNTKTNKFELYSSLSKYMNHFNNV
ncbi:hypothetical protein C3495_14160 (plasmid) [Clostridiaceae bacterium 14S0207]|nr:hypothetical protein C3495_14160 [Clostridiaceae bacterium 14S0207]